MVAARDEFIAGRIDYLRNGQRTGQERFERIHHHASDTTTLRAWCDMDDVGVTRDVSYLLDGQGRPIDAFCRVTRDGVPQGTALFLADANALSCEARTRDAGRVSQSIPAPGGPSYLGLHPLVGDALVAGLRGCGEPGEFQCVAGLTNSHSPNGDEGLLAMPVSIDVAFLGQERIAVPAGHFEALRFALRWSPEWPPAILWVRSEDGLFLRMIWDMIEAEYALVALETRGNERETSR